MTILKFLVLLPFIVISSNVFANESEILFPGNMLLGDLLEVGKRRDLGDYSALHKAGTQFVITKTKVYLTSLDGEVAEITSSINSDSVIAYIKDKNVKVGIVPTASSFNSEDPDGKAVHIRSSGEPVRIILEKNAYLISASGGGLSLTGPNGTSITTLPYWTLSKVFFILWAGDMDRDGRLDLIVSDDGADEKGAKYCLLLSSAAKTPEQLRAVACQHYSG